MDEHLAKKDAQVSNSQENSSFTPTTTNGSALALSSPVLSEAKPGDKCHPATVVSSIHHSLLQVLYLTFRFEWPLKSNETPTSSHSIPSNRERIAFLMTHRDFSICQQILYNAGENKWGTDEDKFTEVLCLRSFPQLKLSMCDTSLLGSVLFWQRSL